MDKRYRIASPLEGTSLGSSFSDRVYVKISTETPDHPSCYEGEWVCEHAPCPVRRIQLRVKALFHQHLPRLRCPLCLRSLVFRCWLNTLTLQETPPEATKKKAATPSRQRRKLV